jgi:hypothetical protein
MNVLTDIPTLILNYKVISNERKFVEQTIDICKINKEPKGLTKNLINIVSETLDKRLLTCPIKEGNYVLVNVRKVDFLNSMKIEENIPGFIPLKGRYVLAYKIWTNLQKKRVNLFNGFEVFEFVES